MAGPEKVYEFGPYRLDASHLLFRNDHLIALPPKATQTLVILVENHGRLVEKEDLMKRVWPDTFVEEANLTLQISALRKVLQEGSSNGAYIETVPRRGYRFVAPVVERLELESQAPSSPPEVAVASRRTRRLFWLAVVGVTCMVAAMVLILTIRQQSRKKPSATAADITPSRFCRYRICPGILRRSIWRTVSQTNC